jgi:tRNA-specific 2-thiouridylase
MQGPFPDPKNAGTVIVGMSGGVDSAVAALLLRDAGYDVQGLFMANWDDDDGYCTTADDFQDARRSCAALGIALHRVSFAAQYRDQVFSHFLRDYAAGRTPNPDVLCNREIKFGVCLDYMHRLGGAWIATGHYAQVRHGRPQPQLFKAADLTKDQSYFLHSVSAAALNKTLFPIGHLQKTAVRKIAHAAGLPVYDKPDSTGICFIGERPFAEFLSRHLTMQPGPIETAEGRVIGEHRGLALYTLGQRSGMGLGGRADAASAPWYVADKHVARNTLVVVQQPDHPLLLSDHIRIEAMHWIDAADAPTTRPLECAVKTRYRQQDLQCSVSAANENTWQVILRQPARAVTPGQYAVLYAGDRCVGGGIIAQRWSAPAARGTPEITYNSHFSAERS